MKLRYARHTSDLSKIAQFYTEVIGLEKLGFFDNHNQYDGIFLGKVGSDWHLEFTASTDNPDSKFDADDILVFYLDTEQELEQISQRLIQLKIPLEKPKNPYWQQNGIMISDPDGYKIVFTKNP